MPGLKNWVRRVSEHGLSALVVPAYAAALRFSDWRYRLTAALLGRGVRTTVHEPLSGGRVAVLATQGGARLPDAIKTLAASARGCAAGVVLVVNGRLSGQARADAASLAHILIERPPVGRDFGAYKAGIDHLASAGIVPERLLIANDSMFYDRNKTQEMIRRFFEIDGDFIAATESHEPFYHIGSFIFAVSARVLGSAAWQRYWRTYRPSSSRPYTIRKGELGLSRALVRGGFMPTVLYTVADVAEWVRSWSFEDLTQRLPMLPSEFRDHVAHARVEQVMRFSLARPVYQLRLADDLLKRMEERSQAHWCGALLSERLGMPIIKKDMAFRELYAMNEFVTLGHRLGYPDMDDFKAEVRRRGIPASLGLFKRCLYRRGYI